MECLDRLPQALPANKPHRVVRKPFLIDSQSIDRNNAWMLQSAGDVSLRQEPVADGLIWFLLGLQFFEGDLAVNLFVDGQPHLAHAAGCVAAQLAKAIRFRS